jgi:P27 family predicted phage terminase small subunit
MGRPGRPPKPSGLRILEGTDRRGRSGRQLDRIREPIAPDGDLVPPYELSDEKQEISDRTVEVLEAMGVASPADVDPLAAYVEAVHLHRWATRELTGQSLVVAGARSGSDVTNKLLIIQAKAATLMLRFAQEFGLTPSARTRIDTTPPPGGGGPRGDAPRKPNPFAG